MASHSQHKHRLIASQINYPNCTEIEGTVKIAGNDITNLNGLSVLTTIGGSLSIGLEWGSGNPSLTSLTGLDNIEESTITDLYIHNNDSLSECEVQSICKYLSAPSGVVMISENAIGCNSPEEVQDSCETHSGLIDVQLWESMILTPTKSTITIELPTQPSKNTFLTLANTNGQQLITQPITKPQIEIDISKLSVGIYIVKVWNDKDVMVQKVIKQ